MNLLLPVLFVSAVLCIGSAPHAVQPAPVACSDWPACRDLALQAHERGEEETFHDLAWRAIQTRGRRDPDLLFLLARAQSASGRPHDALVTLRRLATELGTAHDISQDDDFRRVRALPAWPETEAAIRGVGEAPAPSPATPALPTGPPREEAAAPARGEEVARFPAPRFSPGGLAYDAVSRRFVIGNLPERKLTIVAEGSNRAATLSGDEARLLGVQAIAIDRRRGDLWVVSAGADDRRSELHKLQLISGRVLRVFAPAPGLGPSRFVDVAIAPNHDVLVLDAEGPRLLRPGGGDSLALLMDLPAGTVASLAASDDGRAVYVAYEDRLMRIDLAARSASRVVASKGTELGGFDRIRWRRGTLAAVQRAADGAISLRQVRFGRTGATAVASELLEVIEAGNGNVPLDVLDDELFYLVPGAPDAVIRRIRLK